MALFNKGLVKGLITLLSLGSATVAYSGQTLVGSDGGSASVDNSGQAVWSMPVEVPTGVLGLAPKLQLSVTSGGGNGTFGVGGSLSGMSAITRCSKSLQHDGYIQAPQYTKDDAYCLDGQRLLLQSGTYGLHGSVYRTAIESFQKVTMYVTSTYGTYFVVTNRSGALTRYGVYEDRKTSKVDPSTGEKEVWFTDYLEDTNGNRLTYYYDDIGDGEIQLVQIIYGHNKSNSHSTRLYVNLSYEDRPDVVSGYSRGEESSLSKRVNRVYMRVNSNGDGVTNHSEYRITYRQGEVSGLSRIASVQQCAGNGDCYNPTVFNYTPEAVTQWQASNLSVPAALKNAQGKPLGVMADLNNDGKTDWVQSYRSATGSTFNRTWIHNESGWTENTAYQLPDTLFDYQAHEDGFSRGTLVDINSDGWPDFVRAYANPSDGSDVLQTYRNTGSDFVIDNDLALPAILHSKEGDTIVSQGELVDVNGDALLDVLSWVKLPDGSQVRHTYLQTFSNGVHGWQLSDAYKLPAMLADYSVGETGRLYASLQDVNGDGLVDVVQSYKIEGQLTGSTWLNTGQGWEASAAYRTPVANINYDIHAKGVPEYTFNDVNGDGLPDLVKAIWHTGERHLDTWINTGLTWERKESYALPLPLYVVSEEGVIWQWGNLSDINGDGQPDLIRSYISAEGIHKDQRYVRQGDVWIIVDSAEELGEPFPIASLNYSSEGEAFSQTSSADLDNDGYPEYFGVIEGNLAVYSSSSAGAEHAPGSWIGTQNPLGALTEFYYGLSTDPAVYTLAEQTPYPDVAANGSMRLVKEIRASNGLNDMVSAYHTYGNAKTNLRGLGGYGFAFHNMEDANSGVKVHTQFHQTFPYAGRLKASKKTRNDNDQVFQESSSSMAIKEISIGGLTTSYPYPNGSKSHTYDAFGNLVTTKISTVDTLDTYGNTVKSTEIIKDNSGITQRTVVKDVTYENNVTRWILGLPKVSTQTITGLRTDGTKETFVSKSEVVFYPNSNKVHQEIIEPDNVDGAVTKTYTYDDYGNRVSSTTSANGVESNTTTTEYTPDGRFPISVTNQLGHSITTKFDPVLSKPLEVTNANGIVKEFLYDGFGTTLRETKKHESNGAKRGRQVVFPRFCPNVIANGSGSAVGTQEGSGVNCPTYATYYVAAFDDEGEAPEIAYYDVNGKELRKQTYGFDGKVIVVDTEYDKDSRVIKKSKPYFKGASDAEKLWTHIDYDELGRQIKRSSQERDYYTRYLGLTSKGIEVEKQNPGNDDTAVQITKVISNIFGKPIESIDAAGTSTKYEYDVRGNLLKTIDSAGNVALIKYDPVFGRKIEMNDPDLGIWTYEYNALGQMIRQTDAKQQVTEMSYDVMGRMIERTDAVGTAAAETTKWTYDGEDAGDIKGGLKKIELINPDVVNKYVRETKYDEFSRVVETNTVNHGVNYQQRVGYKGTAAKQDWMQYPTGLTVRSTYDDYGFPKTVEGIQLNLPGYDDFITASKELTSLQRDFQAWKETLSLTAFNEIEELERQVRAKGKRLSEFYDELKEGDRYTDATLQGYQDEAKRFQDLVEQIAGSEEKGVAGKLKEHSNWIKIYSDDQKNRMRIIKNDLASLKTLQIQQYRLKKDYDLKKEHYDSLKSSVDGKASIAKKAEPYFKLIERYKVNALNRMRYNMADHVKLIFEPGHRNKYTNWLNSAGSQFYHHGELTLLEKLLAEWSSHSAYLVKSTRAPGISKDKFLLHFTTMTDDKVGDMAYILKQVNALGSANNTINNIARQHGYRDYGHFSTDYENRSNGLNSYAKNTLNPAAKLLEDKANQITPINNRVKPHLDRINDWLSPNITSHNRIIQAYNDRLRVYLYRYGDHELGFGCSQDSEAAYPCTGKELVHSVTTLNGSYVKREDLAVDRFLKPFKNHINYIKCLRNTAKTSGQCYRENLVFVYSTVEGQEHIEDTEKQNIARAEVDDYASVDVIDFWSDNRFFCSYYRGYSCPSVFGSEIKQLAKSINELQCAKKNTKPDPIDETLSKISPGAGKLSPYDTKYRTCVTTEKNKYHWLNGSVSRMDGNPDGYYSKAVNKHKAKVVELVCNAQKNTYQEECGTTFEKIVAGDTWKANPNDEVKQDWMSDVQKKEIDDQVEASELVMIYRGLTQSRIANLMDADTRHAVSTLRDSQEALKAKLGSAYADYYLTIQDQSKKVQDLYNQVDQAFAAAKERETYETNQKVYWEAEDINASGQILKAKYGNGLITDWDYDEFGRITNHTTYKNGQSALVNSDYKYDGLGNLILRNDKVEDLSEEFNYDIMNRLVQSTLSGNSAKLQIQLEQEVTTFEYDDLGNLTYKSDIGGFAGDGNYTYGEGLAGPHAVTQISGLVDGNFTYDANGNQLSGNERTIDYTAFNKPWRIVKAGDTTLMRYGPERQMIWKQEPQQNGEGTDKTIETTRYIGGAFESVYVQGEPTIHKHSIMVAGTAIATVETKGALSPNSAPVVTKESYLHKDHQGSIVAITDTKGDVLERRHYDAFGKMRTLVGADTVYNDTFTHNPITDMAYTGHMFLQAAGVIHMKGRVFDAVIGRFLSADPHIQSPLNSQSLNRYAYVLNNPLSLVDPSGYFFSKIFKALKKLFDKIKKIIKKIVNAIKKVVKAIGKVLKKIGKYIKKYARVIVSVVVAVAITWATGGMGAAWATSLFGVTGTAASVVGGALVGGLAGGASGLIMTGSLKGMLEGAFFGAVTGGFAKGISAGGKVIDAVQKGINVSAKLAKHIVSVASHGLVGGLRSVVNGGKFLAGFISGAIGKAVTIGSNWLTGTINSALSSDIVKGLVVATAGGIAAELTGGEFAMGFVTAGVAFAVNAMQNRGCGGRPCQQSVRKPMKGKGMKFSYGYSSSGTAITPGGGATFGTNSQYFSDGSRGSFGIAGVGFGGDLGLDASVNFGIYNGNGSGGYDTWSGRFDSFHLSIGPVTMSTYWGGGWTGWSLGLTSDGLAASRQVTEYHQLEYTSPAQ